MEPAGKGHDGASRDPLRVVLADDAMLLREGVARLLVEAGFEVVGQSATADELLSDVRAHSPDVAIVDIRMPPTYTDEGLRAAREIRAAFPHVGIVILSQHADIGVAMQLLAESAVGVGYMLKESVGDLEEFAEAVRRVAKGGSVLDPTIVSQLLGRHRGDDPLAHISDREREVLHLMAEGRSNQGIAGRLAVSERAVQQHVASIFEKLDLPATGEDHRRVLAVLAFLRA
jgi:DNA-binding NarL/FixJ family response regulator